ncbi:MAG: oxygen-independent coproporphyrinogen III oxidase [Clostridia bacterium]|nr:oxygen-independent coproporphyrinogen III oxidase [Clostridia bacterium]
MINKNLGIYVHFPFCKSKCRYCDFNSSDKNWCMEDEYIDALVKEIENSTYNDKVDTVFFGGGTPTAVKISNLIRVIDAVKAKFDTEGAEFTVECNPATIDYDGFVDLKNAGVNRISIGLQSANDDELKFLGRIHTFDVFLKTYEDAKKAGFENINIDLMFSLHQQTLEKWLYTLNKVVDLKPAHISAYSLIVEEGTPFYNLELELPDEETDRAMYYGAVDLLKSKGYEHYEISNFALNGMECKHNIKYWKRDNYLGFGCGASGMYNNVRYQNIYDVAEYIKCNVVSEEILTTDDAMAEHIFLGLRMTDGFNIGEFNRRYNVDFRKKYKEEIKKFKELGLLELDENCRLTKEGLSVSNSVMCEFV